MEIQNVGERRQERHFCRHGKRERALVICSLPCQETGALRSWADASGEGIIITTYFCFHGCAWSKKNLELKEE